MSTKAWYCSKIIWLNVIAGLLAFLPIIDMNFLIILEVDKPEKFYILIGAITTGLNIIFRALSYKGIRGPKRSRLKKSSAE